MQERTREADMTVTGDLSERWSDIVLALACVLTLAWIAFTLWLAAEVLGLV
jgi:hypothetical protein